MLQSDPKVDALLGHPALSHLTRKSIRALIHMVDLVRLPDGFKVITDGRAGHFLLFEEGMLQVDGRRVPANGCVVGGPGAGEVRIRTAVTDGPASAWLVDVRHAAWFHKQLQIAPPRHSFWSMRLRRELGAAATPSVCRFGGDQ